ncbi:hypothetical protein M9H77_03335 [Catharanthus roseus]|uniref:Uncharacterized protein n=1 Tax=Catharanthus roseus TaxID=4058 RepID=A0ACC0CB75_CATRO|nr:hypothetical protein M9H77_03335 [Catharanthus roseus]
MPFNQCLSIFVYGKFSYRKPSMENLRNEFHTVRLKGSFSIRWLDPRYVLICSDLEEDYMRLRLKGSCTLQGQAFLEFGGNRSNEGFGRVWIGTGSSKGFWQLIAYEDLPSYCTNCIRIGHATIACKEQSHKAAALMQSWHQMRPLQQQEQELLRQKLASSSQFHSFPLAAIIDLDVVQNKALNASTAASIGPKISRRWGAAVQHQKNTHYSSMLSSNALKQTTRKSALLYGMNVASVIQHLSEITSFDEEPLLRIW